jgi:hypothetical protein
VRPLWAIFAGALLSGAPVYAVVVLGSAGS